MLVIRRRAGESVLVGEEIEMEVLEIGQGQVKLGIRAPREVVVLRKEVRIAAEENQAASRGADAGSIPGILEALGCESGSRNPPGSR